MGRTNPFLQFCILFYRPTPLPAGHGIAGLLLIQQAGHAGLVGTSSRSLASPLAGKLDPFTVPLLPSRHCDSRAEAARQSRRFFFPACFLRHWRRFSGKLSPRDLRQSRWARAGIPKKGCPARVVTLRLFATPGFPPSRVRTAPLCGAGFSPSLRSIRAARDGAALLTYPTGRPRRAAPCPPGTQGSRRRRWRCGSSCRHSPAGPRRPRSRRRPRW